jgi:thiamine biosynthesis lipoprotein
VRLNADGRLDAPPLDLVRLLELCGQLHRASGGAFDPTVQPLWAVLRRHFETRAPSLAEGPPAAALAEARARLGFPHIDCSSGRIAFARPGMALTLNGIAQGYIADRGAGARRASRRAALACRHSRPDRRQSGGRGAVPAGRVRARDL